MFPHLYRIWMRSAIIIGLLCLLSLPAAVYAGQVIINGTAGSGIAWLPDSANRSLDWSESRTADGTAAIRVTGRGTYLSNGIYQEVSEQITWWRSSTTFDTDFWIKTDNTADVQLALEVYYEDADINTYDYHYLTPTVSATAGTWTNLTGSDTVNWSIGRDVAMIRCLILVSGQSNYYLDDFSLTEMPGPLQPNLTPVADALVTSQTAAQTLVLDARRSHDIDGSIAEYLWNLGDNTAAAFTTGSVVTHTFPADGVYTGFLTVVDERGGRDTTSFTITCPLPSRPTYSKNPVDAMKNGAAYMENSLSEDGAPTGSAGGYGKRSRVNEWLSAEGYEVTTVETFMDSDGTTPDRTDLAGDTTDLNGKLLYPDGSPRYLVVVMPGGNDKKFANSMSSRDVIHNLREFYRNGGSYTGSCAGMSYFEQGYFDIYNMRQGSNVAGGGDGYQYSITGHKFLFRNFLRIWPYYSLNLHEVRSPGIERNLALGGAHPMVDGLVDKSDSTGTYYNDGNSLIKDWVHGMDPDTEYFATYRETYTPSGQPDDVLEGKWAGIGWVDPENPQAGCLALNGWHPETSTRGYFEYDRASVDYAAAHSESLRPRFKATLIDGVPVVMSGDSEKIGDRQYHYYAFHVPTGTTNVAVELSALSDDVDLYVSAGEFPTRTANDHSAEAADTSNRTVSMTSPATGLHVVGVRGESTVPLNGAVYTVTLTLTGTPANNAPLFGTAALTGPDATATLAWGGTITGEATDSDLGDVLTYIILSHDSGPGDGSWLTLEAAGNLYGTPALTDIGTHVYTVQVEDIAGATDTATLTVGVVGSGGTILTDSITETFTAPNGGVIHIGGSSEIIKTADYRWGGYTPDAAVKLQPNTASTYLRMGGIWNSSTGLYVYTRFSTAGNTPVKVLNASEDASVSVTFSDDADSFHNPDGAPVAFLVRDDTAWYISNSVFIDSTQSGAPVTYPLTGTGALTWTQLSSLGDADDVDDGGEGPYAVGTGTAPDLAQLQGWGFAPQGGSTEWNGWHCAVEEFTIDVSWTEGSGSAPAAPSDVVVSNKTTGSLTFDWTDNATDEDEFLIYFGAGGTSPLSSNDSTASDITTWSSGGLSVNTQYAFAVSASNGSGESDKTTDMVVYTLAATPNAPTLDNATTSTLDITPVLAAGNPTGTKFAITVTQDGAAAQHVQHLDGTLAATPDWQEGSVWGALLTVRGLIPDSLYHVTVRARNEDLVETPDSPVTSLRTLFDPGYEAPAGIDRNWLLFK